MKVLIVLAHPNTDKSFNHAIMELVKKTLTKLGHDVVIQDLYKDHFDPILTLNEEKLQESELPKEVQIAMADVRSAQGMIFIHPNWWGTPPAILKGWIDRVFRVGFAYKFSDNGVIQLFTNKTVQIFNTSNTPRDIELTVYHDPLQNFWETIVFGLCGCKSFQRRNFEPVILSTPDIREQWMKEIEQTIKERFA